METPARFWTASRARAETVAPETPRCERYLVRVRVGLGLGLGFGLGQGLGCERYLRCAKFENGFTSALDLEASCPRRDSNV